MVVGFGTTDGFNNKGVGVTVGFTAPEADASTCAEEEASSMGEGAGVGLIT